MNSTVAVVSTVSRQILTNILKFKVRYQKKPRAMAQTQAAMAPSVGVNTPVVMPPIKMHRRHDGQHGLEFEDSFVGHKQQHQAPQKPWFGVAISKSLTSHQHAAIGQTNDHSGFSQGFDAL